MAASVIWRTFPERGVLTYSGTHFYIWRRELGYPDVPERLSKAPATHPGTHKLHASTTYIIPSWLLPRYLRCLFICLFASVCFLVLGRWDRRKRWRVAGDDGWSPHGHPRKLSLKTVRKALSKKAVRRTAATISQSALRGFLRRNRERKIVSASSFALPYFAVL